MQNIKNKVFITFGIALAVLLIAAITLGAVTSGFRDWNFGKPTKDIAADIPAVAYDNDNGSALHKGEIYAMPSALAFTQMSTSGVSASVTLTATVLPVTAANKAVDWSVEWGDSSNTENVAGYISVTPAANGSTTATITCYQAFTGNVVVTVTTRESGYKATCIVTFVGFPTDITITGSIAPTSGAYRLGIGQTYIFDVSLTNSFNSIGSQFNDISCGVGGVGSVVLGYMEHYNTSGNDVWYDASNKTVALDSIKNSFISASYSGGKLSITTIKSIESYYASRKTMDGGRTVAYTDKFRSFVDDCYFKVWVKESNSGLIKEFNVRFDAGVVTAVTISDNVIYF